MSKRSSLVAFGTSALAMCAVGVLGAGPALAHDSDSDSRRGHDKKVTLHADLKELNGSGASARPP